MVDTVEAGAGAAGFFAAGAKLPDEALAAATAALVTREDVTGAVDGACADDSARFLARFAGAFFAEREVEPVDVAFFMTCILFRWLNAWP